MGACAVLVRVTTITAAAAAATSIVTPALSIFLSFVLVLLGERGRGSRGGRVRRLGFLFPLQGRELLVNAGDCYLQFSLREFGRSISTYIEAAAEVLGTSRSSVPPGRQNKCATTSGCGGHFAAGGSTVSATRSYATGPSSQLSRSRGETQQ